MKRLKRTIRVCALLLFMLLATAGIGISGLAPVLTKDRKLFADIEVKEENTVRENKDSSNNDRLNF